MRFFMAAFTFALVMALLPCQGFPNTVGIKLKAPNGSLHNPKKPVKK
jgi:hypothetical protein